MNILYKHLLPIIAILLVQGMDFAYFKYLHNGLKFPDYFPIMLLTIYIAWKYIIKKELKELVGMEVNDRKAIKINFISGLKYGLVVVALALLGGLLSSEARYLPNIEYLKNMAYMILGYLIFIPTSALYEELHYRGIYLMAFSQKYLEYVALIISSVIFSYVHLYFLEDYSAYYPINIFLLGMILSLLRKRKNNLVICIGFHSAWNLFLIALSPLFNEYSERYVEFNAATTIVLTLVLAYEIFKNWKGSNQKTGIKAKPIKSLDIRPNHYATSNMR